MTGTDTRHLDDRELMGIVDGETRAWTDHLDGCEQCAATVATLRARSRAVTEAIDRADFRVPPLRWEDVQRARARRTRPSGLTWLTRAAAILVLLAAPLAALPSVRAWVVDRVDAVRAPAATAPADDPAPLTVLRFSPAPGEFTIRVRGDGLDRTPDRAPDGGGVGALVLARSTGADAVLRATGEVDPVVSAAALDIATDAPGRYQVELPASVTTARVMVGVRVILVTADQIDRGLEIPFDR